MTTNYRKDILRYIQKNLSKGYSLDSLRWALINQDYPRTMVEKVIEEANKELAKEVPAFKEKPKIRYEIVDENNNPIQIKRPWWKRIFR